jgi:hypothetical protein
MDPMQAQQLQQQQLQQQLLQQQLLQQQLLQQQQLMQQAAVVQQPKKPGLFEKLLKGIISIIARLLGQPDPVTGVKPQAGIAQAPQGS